MNNNGGLQILPQTRKKLSVSIPGQNRNFVLSVVFIFVVVAAYFLLWNYRNGIYRKVEGLNGEILKIENARDKTKERQLLILGGQLTNVSQLLNGHISWSKGLEKMNELIQPRVVINSLDVNLENRSFNFSGSAADFATVARQIATFYGDSAIEEVKISGISAQAGKVDFSMELKINTDALLLNNTVGQNNKSR